MCAISYIDEFYSRQDHFDIDLYQITTSKSTRFKINFNLNLVKNLNYRTIRYSESDFSENVNLKKDLNSILEVPYQEFISFNNYNFIDIFLIKKLKRRGVKIILAPDGSTAYMHHYRFAPRFVLISTLMFYKFIYCNKIFFPVLYFYSLKYANLKEIDEVRVQYPDKYFNHNNKFVRKVPILEQESTKKLLFNFFGFYPENELKNNKKIIFYCNQPLRNMVLYDFEFDFLKQLLAKFPAYKLVIKLHPSSSKTQVDRFNTIPNIEIITKTFPAEFYLLSLEDSISISVDSTSSLIKNPSVKYFWIRPIIEKQGLKYFYIPAINPTNYILEVSTIDQIN